MKTTCVIGILLLLWSRLDLSAQTNSYSLDWWTIAGGGGTATGGVYSLSCTLGQSLAGTASGSNYTLTAGFWAVPIQTAGAPFLQVSSSASGVTLSWDKTFGNFKLCQAPILGGAASSWTPVTAPYQTNSTSIYVMLQASGPKQFFRLLKQ